MIRIIKWTLVAVLLLTSIFMLSEAEEMEFLHADGKTIVNEEGKEVRLRGVNIGGWLVQEAWMTLTNSASQTEAFRVLDERFGVDTRKHLFEIYEDHYLSESDFDNIHALGMNVVRIPFAWWNIMDENGNCYDDAFKRLDWAVEQCRARGMYVILDLHAAPATQNGNDHSGDIAGISLWKSEEKQEQTVLLWKTVAEHYRDEPVIAGYDIMNEPAGEYNTTSVSQWELFDRIYRAIRNVDTNHIVIIESCWEPENLPAPSKYGWDNVVYEYHYYKWGADNDYDAQKLFTRVKVQKQQKVNHPVPVFVGEFTLFQSMDAWRFALSTYEDEGWSWTIWTYKVTGRSSWGLFNVLGEKADIYNDSAEKIEKIWKQQGTLIRNDELCGVVREILNVSSDVRDEKQTNISGMSVVEFPVKDATALDGAEIHVTSDGIRLTVRKSGDPGEETNGFCVKMQENTDVSANQYLSFFMKDMQGSNTHRVTMTDADGKVCSVWVDISSVYEKWVRIDMPLSMMDGIDLTRVTEVRIGEWNSGSYEFGRIFCCVSAADE